ncbi:inheritance of peroxisomes protein 1-domain-containing protein [Bombardia bombarda]|uniref:Inheritance of peroxisomes protein 1 n=1 Tax=Bombardia bombarda TaxID=252184 RepID=A0AA39TGV4_9PEZI|nr:inheritance of peroxisomes protein 1-domain-containing protein [Bombardia bombarda]
MEFSKPLGAAFGSPRRVFTAPTYSAHAPQPASSSRPGDGLVDTLYDHPSVKIVSFMAGHRSMSLSSRTSSSPAITDEPGSLPWSSQMERTIAVGPFRIYRAPGSVAFLSCGSALQPILPKSQVWCVDEASSKFVLQIRRPQYWRIELPVDSPEDVQLVELLREVFGRVLQFEKTECPFKRTFTVELPQQPQTPIRKRPWTPARRTSLPPTPVTPGNMVLPARVWKEELAPVADCPEIVSNSERGSSDAAKTSVSVVRRQSVSIKSSNIRATVTPEPHPVEGDSPRLGPTDVPLLPIPTKSGGFLASRSVTAPPQLTLVTSPPSKPRKEGSANSNTTPSPLQVVRHIPLAVIHKTYEIFMSPPSHLINLMLKVAARITAGEWRGFVFGTGEGGEQIPVQWDWSDDEDANHHNHPHMASSHKTEMTMWSRMRAAEDDFSLPAGRKMAGTFPESDDEDSGTVSPTSVRKRSSRRGSPEESNNATTATTTAVDDDQGGKLIASYDGAVDDDDDCPCVGTGDVYESEWSQSWGVD